MDNGGLDIDIIRWQPLTEAMTLRRALERIFDDTAVSEDWHPELVRYLVPPLDMVERGKDIQVKVVVPGVAVEDLDIEIVDDTLTIKGESKSWKEDKKENYFHREWQQGTFVRSLALPEGMEIDKVDAELENGVLTITIPGSETIKPRTIKVKGKKPEKTGKTKKIEK